MVYMVGLPAFVANKVLLPAFYSRKDTKAPVKIALKAMLINVILNFVFVGVLYYFEVVSLHMGLAMAGVGSAWMQCIWLYRKLRQDNIITAALLSKAYVLKISLSLIAMGLSLWWVNQWMPNWYEIRAYSRFLNLFALIVVGAAVYFAAMFALRGHKYVR